MKDNNPYLQQFQKAHNNNVQKLRSEYQRRVTEGAKNYIQNEVKNTLERV